MKQKVSADAFVANALQKNHLLYKLEYFNQQTLCSTVLADFTAKAVWATNHTENLIKTAFGRNELPTWEDFEAFLEERCIPRQRDGLRTYLDVLGVDEYEPFEIIKRTEGRMHEDDQWIKTEQMK